MWHSMNRLGSHPSKAGEVDATDLDLDIEVFETDSATFTTSMARAGLVDSKGYPR